MTGEPTLIAPVANSKLRWHALGVLSCVQFMLVLDDTVVNVALASIHRDLGFELAGLAWVVNAYLLAFGGLLLAAGRAGDLFGRRRVFLAGISLFGLASLACGLAQEPWHLVLGRFTQGIGAAMVSPTALAMVTRLFTDQYERSRALGIWGALAALGGTTGVVASGALTAMTSWRRIFFINLPIAVVSVLLVPRLVTESSDRRRRRLDVPGTVLGTGAVLCLVQGCLATASGDTHPIAPYGWLLLAAGLAVGFVLAETRVPDPVVPASLFTSPARVVGNVGCLLLTATFFAVSVLLMLHMQTVLGYRPLAAGLAYLPYGAGILTGVAVSSALVRRIGLRWTIVASLLMGSGGLLMLARIPTSGEYVSDVLPGLVVAAVGSGIGYPAVSTAALDGTTELTAGVASAVLNTVQQLGAAVGLAVLVGLAAAHSAALVAAGTDPATAHTDGLATTLTVGALALSSAAVVFAGLRRPASTPPRHSPYPPS